MRQRAYIFVLMRRYLCRCGIEARQNTNVSILLMIPFFLIVAVMIADGATKSQKKLTLTTDMVKTEYLKSDHLRLHLKLKYTNHSDSDILLYRYSSSVAEIQILKNSNFGDYKIVRSFQYNSDIYFDESNSILAKDDFVNLRPSESFNIETTADLFLNDNIEPFTDQNYQLKVLVKTLYGRSKEYHRIRNKFFKKSRVSVSNIFSLPMNFRIQKTCQT